MIFAYLCKSLGYQRPRKPRTMTENENSMYESDFIRQNPELLQILLADHTLSTPERQVNIFWATHDYEERGEGYQYGSPILPSLITGGDDDILLPRVLKSAERQNSRSRGMAEVFTPAWICNAQNNLVDNAWFGREGVFNTEVNGEDGSHTWTTNPAPVTFPEGKTWTDYLHDIRMEITCGEAPYLASRYDATTGVPIPLRDRIGLLDRKLRVVNENTRSEPTKMNKREWRRKAYLALQSVYGYDWQGDNVLLARESLLYTFIDYYIDKWGKVPYKEAIFKAADIVSWNIWQMDGLHHTVPAVNGIDGPACKIMEWHGIEPPTGKVIYYRDILTDNERKMTARRR